MRRLVSKIVVVAVAATSFGVSEVASAATSAAPEGPGRVDASSVAVGDASTCVVVTNGRVACWGSDSAGQLGNGDANADDVQSPGAAVVLPGGLYAAQLAAGPAHSCALLNSKQVTCWGSDTAGQLGNGPDDANVASPSNPITLPLDAAASSVAVGDSHSCALLTTGQVSCWGSDDSGQLGNGADVGSDASPNVRVKFAPGTAVTAISAGATHTCAVSASGGVLCWGAGAAGQLGAGDTLDSQVPVAVLLPDNAVAVGVTAGDAHTCALLDDGTVACWGANDRGQLGTGDTMSLSTPAIVTGLDAMAVTAGGDSTCAVTAVSGVSCWGSDSNGQLGNGPATADVVSPSSPITLPGPARAIGVGRTHACALLLDGGLSCWGSDSNGQLGNGAGLADTDVPGPPVVMAVVLPGGSPVAATAVGNDHVCAVLITGSVSCWGDDSRGQLGNGAVTGSISAPPDPIQLPGGVTAESVAAGGSHTCAVLAGGDVSCWGSNSNGQLGIGSTDPFLEAPSAPIALPGGVKAVSLTAGAFFTCALLETGEVTCWGWNRQGQLARGTFVDENVLSPPPPIPLPAGTEAASITAGIAHACALLDTGNVVCWGLGGFGQLGNGVFFENRAVPTPVASMPGGATVEAISAGGLHTCAIISNGALTCWGFNINGQLGTGDTNNRSTPTLVTFPGNPTLRSVSGGGRHTCATLFGSVVSCWGSATGGQIGDGSTSGNRLLPSAYLDLPGGATAVGVSVGNSNSCAVLGTGQLACWGADASGQIGNGEPLTTEPLPVLAGTREIVDPQALDQLPRSQPLAFAPASYTGTVRGTETVVDPVSTATGNLTDTWTDLTENAFGMQLVRSYNGLSDLTSSMGDRWLLATGPSLTASAGDIEALLPDGSRFMFTQVDGGGWTSPQKFAGMLTVDPAPPVGGGSLAMLRVDYANGDVDRFDTNGRLIEQATWTGERTDISYNADGTMSTVASSTGLNFSFSYTGSRVTGVSSSTGFSVNYGYDGSGRLTTVTDQHGETTMITYTAEGWLATLTDPSGVVVEDNQYDAAGRVVSQALPSGAVITMEYVGDGRTIVTDQSTGAVTTYLHDANGNVVAIVDPNDEVAQRLYDSNGNYVEHVSRAGRYDAVQYDDNYNLIQSVEPNGNTTTYTYDNLNRVVSVTAPTGAVTTLSYDGSERVPSTTTDALGNVSTAVIEDGLVIAQTDADGATETNTYDAERRLLTTSDALGNTWSHTYDSKGRLATTASPTGRTTTNTYGSGDRLASITTPDAATTTFTYDAHGRLLTMVDPLGATTSNVYDAAGNLVSATTPSGTTTHEYDASGRRIATIEPGSARSGYTYEELGRLEFTTSPLGDEMLHTYNIEGQRTSTTVGSTSAESQTMYDQFGRVEQISDAAGRATINTYDEFGRLVAIQAPGGAQMSVSYDALDRQSVVVDARGGRTEYTYTPGGREATTTTPDGTTTSYTYDAMGQITAIDTPDGTTTYTYNADGERTSETTPSGLVTTFEFDLMGRVTSMIDPAGVATALTYTLRGELATEKVGAEGARAYTYNADGTLASATDALGITTTMTYDGRSNLVSRSDALGGVETWTYNAADQITSFTDQLGRTTTVTYDVAGRATSFADPAGRITEMAFNPDNTVASATTTDGAETTTKTFGYDAAGRVSQVDNGNDTATYTYNSAGDLLERIDSSGALAYAYDDAGRRTSLTLPDGVNLVYDYDVTGRLAMIERSDEPTGTPVASYAYDADGRLVTETLPGGSRTWTYTDGQLTNLDQQLPDDVHDTALTYDSTGRVESEVTTRPSDGDAPDPLVCDGLTATVVGTEGNDLLFGTNSADVIVGLGGSDIIFGFSGDDIVCGGDGRDLIFGSSGADTIQGGDGNDLIVGGFGKDSLDGGNGYDIVDGSRQRDTCDDAEVALRCETKTNNGEPDPSGDTTTAVTYTYDNASQLLAQTVAGGATTSWTYDQLGRRTSEQVAADTTTYAYDAAGQLCWTAAASAAPSDCDAVPAGAATFGWDASGRLTSESTAASAASYSYDSTGRLVGTTEDTGSSTTTQLREYSPDGSLASLITDDGSGPTTSTLVWDLIAPGVPTLASITDADGTTDLVSGPGGWAATIGDGSIDPIGLDVHKSVTSAVAGLARAGSYDAFGVADGAGTFTPTLGYRGELTLADNVHLRARDYRPDLGRFTSRDPIQGVAGSTTLANAYHYTTNSPLNHTDPTGMFQDAVYSAEFVAAVGVIAAVIVLQVQFGILATVTAGFAPPLAGISPGTAIAGLLIFGALLYIAVELHTLLQTAIQTAADSLRDSKKNCNQAYKIEKYGRLRAPGCERHHILQDKAFDDKTRPIRKPITGYTSYSAPAIVLSVPAHLRSSAAQRNSKQCGGTYADEFIVAQEALVAASVPPLKQADAMKAVADYFVGIGATPATEVHIPRDRVACK